MLFLIQAGVDLLFPELCQEEGAMSRRHHWFSGSCHRSFDQPGCSACAWPLSGNAVDWLVCARALVHRVADNRPHHVTRYLVGPVPALLGAGEIRDNRLGCNHLVYVTQTLDQLGALARDTTLSIDELRDPSPVLHSGLAVLALLVNTTLSIYKPKGMTKYGRRKQREQQRTVGEPIVSPIRAATE
jgi:hypothetical protein